MKDITPNILSQGVELKGLETLKTSRSATKSGPPTIRNFLRVLDDDDIEWSVIENNVDQKLSDLKGKEKDKIDFDGVFITAIREVLKKL